MARAAGAVRLITGPRGDSHDHAAPYSVDCRLSGACQLRCAWCWGPAHSDVMHIRPLDWVRIIASLAERGTRHVVFSGGEPTMSSALRPALHAAKVRDLRVTLSTNGIRFGRSRDIVGRLDEIGIPIDGSTPEVHAAMRGRSDRHRAWEAAVEAIQIVQAARAAGETKAEITVRTVIARPNLDDVTRIPHALANAGIDLATVRFKLYQVEPIGPHAPATDFGAWAVSAGEARSVANAVQAAVPATEVRLQLYENTAGRYFLIDPDGTALGTGEDEQGAPREVRYGNVLEDLEVALATWREQADAARARQAARDDSQNRPMI